MTLPNFFVVVFGLFLIVFISLLPRLRIISRNARIVRNAFAVRKLVRTDIKAVNALEYQLNFLIATIITDKPLLEIRNLLDKKLKKSDLLTVIGVSDIKNNQIFLINTFPSTEIFQVRGHNVEVTRIYPGLARLEKSTLSELQFYTEIPENNVHDFFI